jgi:hypothetical protein
METEKAQLEKRLFWLSQAGSGGTKELPPGYQPLVESLSSELRSVVQRFNQLLDEYLSATITSLVVVQHSPIVSRTGFSPIWLLTGMLFLSAFLAFLALSVEHLYKRAREEDYMEAMLLKQRSTGTATENRP